jgi:hypothetical protein
LLLEGLVLNFQTITFSSQEINSILCLA